MSKTSTYIAVWAVLIGGVLTQVYLAINMQSFVVKTWYIIIISFLEVITSGLFFQDLRNETPYLSLVPIIGFLVVITLIIGAVAGGG